MKLKEIVAHAINKQKFTDLNGYVEFCKIYLDHTRNCINSCCTKNQPDKMFKQITV